MGIQINGTNDTISASDGSLSVAGQQLTDVTNINATGIVTATTYVVGTGSTSAPSITPSGDSNTGIFFPSADTIAFGEGGAEAARIDSSGRFGLGTSSPGYLLHLAAAAPVLNIASSETTGDGAQIRLVQNNGRVGRLYLTAEGGPGAGAMTLETPDGRDIVFKRTSTENARIDSSGRLLVGTSSAPSAGNAQYGKLVVLGNTAGSAGDSRVVIGSGTAAASLASGESLGQINFTDNAGNEFAQIRAYTDGASGANDFPGRLVFSTTADGASSPTERMRLDSSGRLGIGTTSPSDTNGFGNALDLNGTTGSALYVRTNGSATNFGIIGHYGTDFYVNNNSNGPTRFYTNGSERARIDSSGRLLVGTSTAPSAGNSQYSKLVVQANTYSSTDYGILNLQRGLAASSGITGTIGSINFSDNAGNEFALIQAIADGTTGSSDYPGRLMFSTTADGASSPTERMRIKSDGSILAAANSAGNWGYVFKNEGNNNDRSGVDIWCGRNDASGTNYAISIRDGDGTTQGWVTFSEGTVTYGAFTAYHPCILPDEDNNAGYPYGTLVETTAIEYSKKNGVSTERGIRYKVRKTQSANSKAVLGAYGSSMNDGPDKDANLHQALVLGDGHILCNGSGGNIKVGDGICSSAVAGIGQKAIATPSMIIGIAQEDITFDGDETKLVPVQYGLQQFIPWQE